MSLLDSAPAKAPAPAQVARPSAHKFVRWIPYALALLFAVTSLRSLPCGNVIDTDAARHAMNGAFVHDLVKSGNLTHPVAYGKQYYSRLPSVSLPYHPPVFPALEAAIFFIFGVNLTAARVLVALMMAVSVLLFYRLVIDTHGSHAVAAASVLFFFGWRWTQLVANDVMLEVPSLVFALAALYLIRRLDSGFHFWNGVAFALLAGTAVWTKQTAVFLGAVPFGAALLARNWRVLFGKTIWISAALYAGTVLSLIRMSSIFRGTDVEKVTNTGRQLQGVLWHNLFYYGEALARTTGYVFALGGAIAVIIALVRTIRKPRQTGEDALYLSWSFAAIAFILALGLFDERYLFFALAPLAVITFAMVDRLARRALGVRSGWWAATAIGTVYAGIGLAAPVPYLSGPAEAARSIASKQAERILYCGRTNGSFTFAVRTYDSELHDVIIRGDKLPPEFFNRPQFEDFAHRLGVNYIVLERSVLKRSWDPLFDSPTASMAFLREIRQTASDGLADGRLRVYRFTNPSPVPEDTLKLRIKRLGEELEMKF